MSNQYRVQCACGRELAATASMAGTVWRCACGQEIEIPVLSELRRLAGKAEYVTNIVEELRLRLSRGENPAGKQCLCCGVFTDELQSCEVVCEQPWNVTAKEGKSTMLSLLLMGMGALFGYLLFFRQHEAPETEPVAHGRETVIRLPMPVCADCQRLRGDLRRPVALRRMLLEVPDYRKLFEEYPGATIVL
jgi:hypothetical protein